MKFKTKLWKRSEKSFASTIPHIALLTMDEEKNHEVVWEYNAEIGKWTFELKPLSNSKKTKNKKQVRKLTEEIKDNLVKKNSKNKSSVKENSGKEGDINE